METASEPLSSKIIYVLLGLAIGAILSFTFVFFFVLDKEKDTSTNQPILSLILTNPEPDLATSNKTITVAGTTKVKSLVTVNSSQKSTIIEAKEGTFSTKVDLLEGKNLINITAFDPQTGESQTTTREILYLDEDLSNL